MSKRLCLHIFTPLNVCSPPETETETETETSTTTPRHASLYPHGVTHDVTPAPETPEATVDSRCHAAGLWGGGGVGGGGAEGASMYPDLEPAARHALAQTKAVQAPLCPATNGSSCVPPPPPPPPPLAPSLDRHWRPERSFEPPGQPAWIESR